MRKKLTDAVISTKPPKVGRLEFWDTHLPGFGLRITDKGARSYFVMYRVDRPEGRLLRRLKIGDAKVIDLAQARKNAREKLGLVASGIDPAEQRPVPSAAPDTFRTVAESYLRQYVAKNTRASTFKETKRILDVDVIPAWGDKPIAGIAKRDVEALLDTIADRGAEVQANRTLARLRTLFNWAVEKDHLTDSPVVRMRPRVKEHPRDRALSDDEIRWFWQACEEIGWPFGPLFQLLLLTAQRRDEVGTIEWPEIGDIEKRLWSIGRQKAKNDRAHDVHLSELAVEIISALPKMDGTSLVFTTNSTTPVSGFSRAKENLDAAMRRARRRSLGLPEDDEAYLKALALRRGKEPPEEIAEWILHDLRRTAATGMARLNIPPHVVDKVLNHVSGTIRGVAAVYNRFGYVEERKAALEAWGRYVAGLVRPAETNVIEIRSKA
jgi:integrase